jgi:hypothetical protein
MVAEERDQNLVDLRPDQLVDVIVLVRMTRHGAPQPISSQFLDRTRCAVDQLVNVRIRLEEVCMRFYICQRRGGFLKQCEHFWRIRRVS